MTKYHLYMDESGDFEGQEAMVGGSGRCSILFGLLVPDESGSELRQAFSDLATEYELSGFVHAADLHKKVSFGNFSKNLVRLTRESDLIPFVMSFNRDIYADLPDAYRESYAANRYLSMAQTAIEHILFLHPDFYGRDIIIDLHPNSRVYPVARSNTDVIRAFTAMGFGSNVMIQQKKEYQRFYLWNADSLRAYVHRMALEYIPWQHRTGRRAWEQIETIVASTSADPFVHWVDILAWIYRGPHTKTGKKLQKIVQLNLAYGFEEQEYKKLVQLYLSGNIPEFIIQALAGLPSFKGEYYKKNLAYLVNSSLSGVALGNLKYLRQVEESVGIAIRPGTGDWDFFLKLTERLLAAAGQMPADDPDAKRLLIRLLTHKISIHNHRGEPGLAWQTYRDIEGIGLTGLSLEDFRERLALKNRMGVTAANVFAFEQSNEGLQPLVNVLETSLRPLKEQAGCNLSDPLIGRLKGTMGQNCAFLAPRQAEKFAEAERLFIAAAEEFTDPDDRLRHVVNLLHLYLDAGESNKARDCVRSIYQTPGFQRFEKSPDSDTCKRMEFPLFSLVKYFFHTGSGFEQLLTAYPLENLKKWFGRTVNEHPFELICAYLGRMALQLDHIPEANNFLDHALAVPKSDIPADRPTFQALRSQIWAWWALETADRDQEGAMKKMRNAVTLLQGIAGTTGLETMLAIQDDGSARGWFAPGWQALSAMDWEKEFNREACEEFLKCFTFNYH